MKNTIQRLTLSFSLISLQYKLFCSIPIKVSKEIKLFHYPYFPLKLLNSCQWQVDIAKKEKEDRENNK